MLVTALLGGCAFTYETTDKVTTFGLVWMQYRKPVTDTEPEQPSGSQVTLGKQQLDATPVVVQQSTIGIALDTTRASGGFTLGYKNNIQVFPKQNKVTYVDYNTRAPMDATVVETTPRNQNPEPRSTP